MSEATADDFSWLDDPPKKRGPPKGRPLAPEHAAKLRNNGKGQKGVKKGYCLNVTTRRNKEGVVVPKTMTESKWRRILELQATGATYSETFKSVQIKRSVFDAYLISNVGAAKQIREARLIWNRRNWSMEEIEEILSEVSLGQTVKAAAEELGYDKKRLLSFYQLVHKDRAIKEMYDDARELQAEAWLDDIMDITDVRNRDTFMDHKGMMKTNHAAIQRDKLRVDTRVWGMGALNRKRFGDNKHIDLTGQINVDHAVTLSAARKRVEQAKRATIDNATQQVISEQ